MCIRDRSGTVRNVLLVIPVLLMNVSACSCTVVPYPERTITSSGNFAPPWLTKYAGPVNGTGSSGVVAFAVPTRDSVEQPAGFCANVLSGQAFCNVLNRDGNCFGRSTLTLAIFA